MVEAAVWVTLRLAIATTAILLALGLPLAYWLTTSRWRAKFVIEAIVALPVILPPTVLGFYLLVALGPKSPIGNLIQSTTGRTLPFSFAGILVGSVLFNLPFAVRPFVAAFASVDRRLIEASWCLGATRFRTFRSVIVPLARPGILTGVVLSFAHTVGEFGVVLMLGGNIPSITQTISTLIYDDVQAMNYGTANLTAGILLVFSVCVLTVVYSLPRRVPGL